MSKLKDILIVLAIAFALGLSLGSIKCTSDRNKFLEEQEAKRTKQIDSLKQNLAAKKDSLDVYVKHVSNFDSLLQVSKETQKVKIAKRANKLMQENEAIDKLSKDSLANLIMSKYGKDN